MARVAYSGSKKQFIYDWDTNRFMDLMCEGANRQDFRMMVNKWETIYVVYIIVT